VSEWIRIASVADCPSGTCREFVAGERIVALFHADGAWHALDGVCPHQGGPLGQGTLSGCTVTCPWHGWQFDVRSGANLLGGRIVQPSFDVRIEGEGVLVRLV